MNKLNLLDRVSIGYALFDAGFPPSYSSDLCHSLTVGYGELSCEGVWQYPLFVENLDLHPYAYQSIIPWNKVKNIIEEINKTP